jgi:hypothetical protein
VTDLQGQVVKAQMRQGQIATIIEMVEERAKTARTDVERTFDDLLCATDARIIELRSQVRESQQKWRLDLELQQRECSVALIDIWRQIDFLAKIMAHGTDTEILSLKGHIFKDKHNQRQLHQWSEMIQPGLLSAWPKGSAKAGWRCPEETEDVLNAIANGGNLVTSTIDNPLDDEEISSAS